MKISIAQINSIVGDLDYNFSLITKATKEELRKNVFLVITPKLSLPGYPPEDLLFTIKHVYNGLFFVKLGYVILEKST